MNTTNNNGSNGSQLDQTRITRRPAWRFLLPAAGAAALATWVITAGEGTTTNASPKGLIQEVQELKSALNTLSNQLQARAKFLIVDSPTNLAPGEVKTLFKTTGPGWGTVTTYVLVDSKEHARVSEFYFMREPHSNHTYFMRSIDVRNDRSGNPIKADAIQENAPRGRELLLTNSYQIKDDSPSISAKVVVEYFGHEPQVFPGWR